jgi:hypothetical protein
LGHTTGVAVNTHIDSFCINDINNRGILSVKT